MPDIKFTNNAVSYLAAAINSAETTIAITPGDGAEFPSLSGGDFFYATLEEESPAIPSAPVSEIVKVTARSTDSMTVVRGQDGTAAAAWLQNDRFEVRITAESIRRIRMAGSGVQQNSASVTQDTTIESGFNGLAAGTIEVADGVTVTIPSGSTLVVV